MILVGRRLLGRLRGGCLWSIVSLRPVLGRWQLGMMRRLRRSGWPVSGLAYLTELTTVSRGSVAAQWARNINQYRYNQGSGSGTRCVCYQDQGRRPLQGHCLHRGEQSQPGRQRREVRRASERSSPSRVRLHRRERQSEVVRHQGKGDGNVLKRGRPVLAFLLMAACTTITGAESASAEPVRCPSGHVWNPQ